MWKINWKVAKQIGICGSNVVRNYKLNLDIASEDSKQWLDSDYLGDNERKGSSHGVWIGWFTTHPGVKEKSPVRNGDGLLDLLCSLGIQVKILGCFCMGLDNLAL